MAWALIPARIVPGLEVLLVVVLCVPPFASRQDFRYDLSIPPLLVHQLGYLLGDLLLLGVVEVDAGSVLAASIGTLSVEGGGIMHAVEEL